MGDALLGLDGKVYYLSTGSRASWGTHNADGIAEGGAPANLTEIDIVRDVTIGASKGEADVSCRRASGWRLTKGTLKEGELSFETIHDPTDAGFAKLMGAYLNNTSIAMAILDGDKAVAGSTGLWADFDVIGFEKGEPLEEAQVVSWTLKPTYSTVAPEWVKVTA